MGLTPHFIKSYSYEHITHYPDHLTIYAIILLLIGLLLRYLIGRRRFNRRNIAGLQHFRSYSQALFITTFEKLLNLSVRY
ncbi:hypothetical protein [Mucilaginibacter sp. 3215]|uniref:hypothetical protein n=1 Tax=Mucilaginibacter sp. 3215 TaxID=3373912 RepID=UPI003D19548F